MDNKYLTIRVELNERNTMKFCLFQSDHQQVMSLTDSVDVVLTNVDR